MFVAREVFVERRAHGQARLLQLDDRSTPRASLIEERLFDVDVFGNGVSLKCETLHAIEPQVQTLFRHRRAQILDHLIG